MLCTAMAHIPFITGPWMWVLFALILQGNKMHQWKSWCGQVNVIGISHSAMFQVARKFEIVGEAKCNIVTEIEMSKLVYQNLKM
jgi:hypothetical protein